MPNLNNVNLWHRCRRFWIHGFECPYAPFEDQPEPETDEPPPPLAVPGRRPGTKADEETTGRPTFNPDEVLEEILAQQPLETPLPVGVPGRMPEEVPLPLPNGIPTAVPATPGNILQDVQQLMGRLPWTDSNVVNPDSFQLGTMNPSQLRLLRGLDLPPVSNLTPTASRPSESRSTSLRPQSGPNLQRYLEVWTEYTDYAESILSGALEQASRPFRTGVPSAGISSLSGNQNRGVPDYLWAYLTAMLTATGAYALWSSRTPVRGPVRGGAAPGRGSHAAGGGFFVNYSEIIKGLSGRGPSRSTNRSQKPTQRRNPDNGVK